MARVLLVEDEPDIQDLVTIGLIRLGHEVLVADTGERGLTLAAETQPDVILLDVVLPGLQGWEVLTHLKTCPVTSVARIPVIMLTTENSSVDRIRGGIEGAVRYLAKPFLVSELRQAVTEVLSGGSEPAMRRQAQEDAMRRLTRMETTGVVADLRDPPPASEQGPPREEIGAAAVARLSHRQREVLAEVSTSATVTAAAERLEMSRTSVYANLHRAARRLGVPSARELLELARAGAIRLD